MVGPVKMLLRYQTHISNRGMCVAVAVEFL